jgi:peptide chain release factor 2
MLVDELREKIKSVEPDINVIQTFWKQATYDQDFERLQRITSEENFWQNPQQTDLMKELQRVKLIREQYTQLMHAATELSELIDLFAQDEQEIEKLKDEVYSWARKVIRFKISLLLQDEVDAHNCFFSINSGAGGTESQDWAEILLRMYVRFCERESFQVAITDYQSGEAAGIKSATLFIKGKNSYGLLKGEAGVHRLVRISPYDASKRRHTSFAAVTVVPEIPTETITIDPKDLRVDTYRAGGAGGQHVNKTDSAVRITHIPTNIVVQCQSERSQLQNKETAMKMLMAKLVQKEKDEQKAREASIERKKIEWGSQIRSYILHPYKMVKDHRTDWESPQPELVLDGDLMECIEANLVHMQTHT